MGTLCFKKKWVRFLFRLVDFFSFPSRSKQLPKEAKKILICHFGSLGDFLLSTDAITSIKKNYPDATVDFLTQSALSPLVKGLKFDHWYSCKAALHYFSKRREIVQKLRAEKYDIAIDLHPFFPNAAVLLKKAKIGLRIGYTSGGFGSYFTHRFNWERGKYLADLHLERLKEIGIAPVREPVIYPSPKLPLPGRFIVIHMCSSCKEKDWTREGWIQLIRKLKDPVILMGQGKDKEECEAVARETGCMNLCDQVSIFEYGAILQRAKLLISVDSMPVHLAFLTKTHMAILYRLKEDSGSWLPSHDRCKSIFLSSDLSVDEIVYSACMLLS